jgi:hypothetical protein
MKYQKPVNSVNSKDEFSSGLMESYGQWMGGDCFQNTDPVELNLHEAPFDGMDAQSHGAEIEDTTKKKKAAKKGAYAGQESAPKNEEVLEREEYEVDGETYVIEKKKGLDGKACWKGYKLAGTKKKGGKTVDNCVKAGDEIVHDGEELEEAVYGGAAAAAEMEKKKKIQQFMKGVAPGKGFQGKYDQYGREYDTKTGKLKEETLAEKKLDPVGQEDKDIDNDGDHDKSDKYLLARRKKVGKILAMKKKK